MGENTGYFIDGSFFFFSFTLSTEFYFVWATHYTLYTEIYAIEQHLSYCKCCHLLNHVLKIVKNINKTQNCTYIRPEVFHFFFFFLVALRFEPFALARQGFTTWATPPALFDLLIFEIRSCFLPGPWAVSSYFTLPAGAGMTGECYNS
jgi:hypothetical protein